MERNKWTSRRLQSLISLQQSMEMSLREHRAESINSQMIKQRGLSSTHGVIFSHREQMSGMRSGPMVEKDGILYLATDKEDPDFHR